MKRHSLARRKRHGSIMRRYKPLVDGQRNGMETAHLVELRVKQARKSYAHV
ncbi:hypothetical protein [Alistipes putredinis]|uniref:hypothetical protein n=1 Tax=Alistipes putredinis TaxID=28117 RepID=UPI003AF0DC5B